jgi:hypothetical protein
MRLISPRQTLQQYSMSYLRLLKPVSKRRGPIRVKTLLHNHRSLNFLVFSPFWQRKAFFSFSFGDPLLAHIYADLCLRNCPKHPWIRVSAHGSRRHDINMIFTHELNSSTATSNGTQKIQINLGNHRRCLSVWLLCFWGAWNGAMGSFHDYVISFLLWSDTWA